MSSAFLDHPVLKVSRPVAACSRCRTAKIKCDGKLPSCSACERANKASSCSGASDEFARGKERSYVASLEGYCERLERRLADVRKQSNMLTAAGDGGQVPQSSITAFAAENTSSVAHRREVSDIDDLVGDFGFLSVNATSRDFRGITSNVSFAQLLLTTSTVEPLPPFSNRSLPPRYEATRLIRHFFNNIYIQLPFFTETAFWTSVEAVYQSEGRFAKPIDNWMLRMVLAISHASLWPQNQDGNHQFAFSMVSSALDYSDEVLHPGSMRGIQAILLLTLYSLFDPVHFRPRFLISFAARVMVDLGLHQDPPTEVLSDKAVLEQRRRLFYCLYSLDRAICSAMKFHFSFSDASVDVALPHVALSHSPANEGSLLSSLEPAVHLFKIRRILSTGYQEMYGNGRSPSAQPLLLTWKLCAEARDWYDQAPTNIPSSFNLLYRLELLYSTIVFLSPSYRDPVICDFSKALLFDRCIDYISQFHQVVVIPSGLPLATFLDIQRVRQIGQRFVTILNEDYDLLVSNIVPEAPTMPPGTPEPPYLAAEDRINCHARALRCLLYIEDILQYGLQRWNTRQEYDGFVRDSAALKVRLEQQRSPHEMPHQEYVSADGYQGMQPDRVVQLFLPRGEAVWWLLAVAPSSRTEQSRPQANPPSSEQLTLPLCTLPHSVTYPLQSQTSILYAASPHQIRSLPINSMHYNSIFICFVAVFLCFTAHRTNGLPSSEHDTGARFVLAMQEDNQLIQLLEDCDQSLDEIPTTTTGSCTSLPPGFPETCKKLMTLLDNLLNTHHSIIPRFLPDIEQIPFGSGRNYGLQRTASETATEAQAGRYDLAARSFDLIARTTGRNHSREVCEAKACPKKDLKRACTAKKLQPKVAEMCKMCYPKPNAKLINEHCQKRWKRERRAFYIVCFVLIGVTLVSGLVLRLRRLYVEKRGQKETEEGTRRTGELYHYDGAKSSAPNNGPKSSGPYNGPKSPIICYDGANSSTSLQQGSHTDGPTHAVDEDEQFDELWEEDECDIGSSTAHKKWKQLGLLSRNSRKRVQDLFDVESTRSKRENGNQQSGDKIPVMPRAPNATVRQTNQGSRRGRFERQSSRAELRQVPTGGTI